MTPNVNGILESALYVDDLDRAVEFYETVFGFEILTRGRRICAMGVAGRDVLLLFHKGGSVRPTRIPGGVIPPTDADGEIHLAFSVSATELDRWQEWLRQKSVPIESTVKWGRGGTSIYFRDPDRHLIELVTPGTWSIY